MSIAVGFSHTLSGQAMTGFGCTRIPCHRFFFTTCVLRTAKLINTARLVLRMYIARVSGLKHIARTLGFILWGIASVKQHMAIERKRGSVTGFGTALKKSHRQTMLAGRACHPAGM